MLPQRDQLNQTKRSIDQIQSNPIELNHMISSVIELSRTLTKKWSNRTLIRFDCVR